MRLIKGNDVVELTSQGHIDAFKQAGYTEYAEPKKAKKKAETAENE
jgi:hypothetical protein